MSMTSSPVENNRPARPEQMTLMLVSHTHWDREWYQTFQQFRFKLVRLIDRLLDLLDRDPAYQFFMLDGQTVVLEDYLEVRPDRRAELERQIRAGRIQIGPWYVLSDQFLVSGEAHIQNLLRGLRTATEFGSPMRVGYVPDPFGQTGQTPQVLRGFGIDNAVFWRGVGPELGQVEYVWAAPDGTTVDGVWLPGDANLGGYSSALNWNSGPEAAIGQLTTTRKLILDKVKSGVALLMNGNDHTEPSPDLASTIRSVQAQLAERGEEYNIVHGTIPRYLEQARQSGVWQNPATPRHIGEFRDSQLAPLLPGVTSSRMWIKQTNNRIENLLEREAGPALAWLNSLDLTAAYDNASLRGLYRTAWKHLLQNHAHDSICGCSIDQVHEEMRTRFAWAEQIGQELLQEGWRGLIRAINTSHPDPKALPIVINNPVPTRRTEIASLAISAPDGLSDVVVTDEAGEIMPHRMAQPDREMLFSMDIPAFALAGMAAQAGDEGRVMDYTMSSVEFRPGSNSKVIDVEAMAVYQSAAPTDPALMKYAMAQTQKLIEQGGIETFRLAVFRQTGAQLEFLAKDVPPTGYKTFFMRPRQTGEPIWTTEKNEETTRIENEFYELSVDATTGLFTVQDKETGAVFSGLNQFRDGADAGDTYNYAPPTQDTVITKFFAKPSVTVTQSALESTITLDAALELPFSLSDDRQHRGSYKTICPLTVTARLVPGQHRIDFTTSFINDVEDHRLQVLFPAPFAVTSASAEQAFDVLDRPVSLPKFNSNWIEDPMPTAPHKTFVSLYDPDQKIGLSLINRGLPEYEVMTTEDGHSAVGLTLLRCVGWLSRSDLSTRRNHAGPGIATPQAQLKGRHTFHYALTLHRGDWLQAGAQAQAHAFNHLLTGVTGAATEAANAEATLPPTGSFLEILPRVVALSTVKPSEDGQAIIVRLWNPAQRDIPAARVRLYRPPTRASLVNLAEDAVQEELIPDAEGWLTFPLAAKRIATIRVEF